MTDRPVALHRQLTGLDGKSYGAYKSLRGSHRLPEPQGVGRGGSGRLGAELIIDRVQSDPFAPPSKARVLVPVESLPYRGASREVPGRFSTAELDLLCRRLVTAFGRAGSRGLSIDRPGQQVLPRAAVTQVRTASGQALHICFEISMPARGRRILGHEAARLICEALPSALADALLGVDPESLDAAAELEYDQAALRTAVDAAGLIGFVADDAVLPRKAGNSDLPKPDARPFRAPATLATEFVLPSGRAVAGMGIPRGVTLIVGGGYHGKSTLLSALVTGVYDHIAGDGREFVVADASAVALRAEDGRAITGTDISPFINGLPSGEDTTRFSTTNASGSTSQAAGLMEALEVGARVLLIDEDTSATNFMIRDERMRALVPDEREPITPLVARVRQLWEDHGVSTVIVAGGSGAFIDVADTVIAMDAYEPHDVTARARELAEAAASGEAADSGAGASRGASSGADATLGDPFNQRAGRFLRAELPENRGHHGGRGRGRNGGSGGRGRVGGAKPPKPPRARGRELIQIGKEDLDLRAVSQIVDSSQTEAIARVLARVMDRLDGDTDVATAVQHELASFSEATFGDFGNGTRELPSPAPHPGRLALPRLHEVAAAINRLRNLT
nr:ABC-ATPase domain-containing protein [Corynebacterium lactis]